jgi:hypothetical protein
MLPTDPTLFQMSETRRAELRLEFHRRHLAAACAPPATRSRWFPRNIYPTITRLCRCLIRRRAIVSPTG